MAVRRVVTRARRECVILILLHMKRACVSLHGYVYKNNGKRDVFNIQAAEKTQPSMDVNFNAERESHRRMTTMRGRERCISNAFARVCSTLNRYREKASDEAVRYAVREIKELEARHKDNGFAGCASANLADRRIILNNADASFVLEVVNDLWDVLDELERNHGALIVMDAMRYFSGTTIPPPESQLDGKAVSLPSRAVVTDTVNAAALFVTIGDINETRTLITGLVSRANAAECSAVALSGVLKHRVGLCEKNRDRDGAREFLIRVMRLLVRWYRNPVDGANTDGLISDTLRRFPPNCAAAIAFKLATHCERKYRRYLRR